MNCNICPVCGATWYESQLYWRTGKPGKNEDLNALVCRQLPDTKAPNCINPAKGTEGGIGWAERSFMMEVDFRENGL